MFYLSSILYLYLLKVQNTKYTIWINSIIRRSKTQSILYVIYYILMLLTVSKRSCRIPDVGDSFRSINSDETIRNSGIGVGGRVSDPGVPDWITVPSIFGSSTTPVGVRLRPGFELRRTRRTVTSFNFDSRWPPPDQNSHLVPHPSDSNWNITPSDFYLRRNVRTSDPDTPGRIVDPFGPPPSQTPVVVSPPHQYHRTSHDLKRHRSDQNFRFRLKTRVKGKEEGVPPIETVMEERIPTISIVFWYERWGNYVNKNKNTM